MSYNTRRAFIRSALRLGLPAFLFFDLTPRIFADLPGDVAVKKGETIRYVASVGTSDEMLGSFYNGELRSLNLNKLNGPVRTTPESVYLAHFRLLDIDIDYRSHFGLFSLLNLSQQQRQNRRFAVLSVYCIQESRTIDPENDLRGDEVEFFVRRVHYGWALHHLISGSLTEFSTQAGLNLQEAYNLRAGFEDVISEFHLSIDLSMRGLRPKENVPRVILSPNDIPKYFEVAKDPIPIFLELEALRDIELRPSENRVPIAFGSNTIRSISVEISALKPIGNSEWDGDGSLPDPVAILYLNGKKVAVSNERFRNKSSATFTFNSRFEAYPLSRIEVKIFDTDFLADDYVGSAQIKYEDFKNRDLYTEIPMAISPQSGLTTARIVFGTYD